jgi:hypothetical protein
MRILMTTNAPIEHLLPMASTVAEFANDGARGTRRLPRSIRAVRVQSGVRRAELRRDCVSMPVPPPPRAADHDGRLMWAVTLSWPSDSRSWVDSLLRHAKQWRPDLVMVEPIEHAGRIVAAAVGLPLVAHGWGFTLPAHVEDVARAGLADRYERVSATPSTPVLEAELGLSLAQAPDVAPAQRYRYRPFPGAGQSVPPRRIGKRRVLVTLGTYPDASAAPLIRAAVTTALENDAEVIAVLGHHDWGSGETFPPARRRWSRWT